MIEHPQQATDVLLKERLTKHASSIKQRIVDSTSTLASKLPNRIWSIKIPKVYMDGTELAFGSFEHIMFVQGTKKEARRVAKIITGLGEKAEERPNWKIEKGFGEEYIIDAKKFLDSKG